MMNILGCFMHDRVFQGVFSCLTYTLKSKLLNCPVKRLQLLSSLCLLGNRHSVTVVMETEAGNHFVTDEEYTRKKHGVGRSCPFVVH